MISSYEFWEKKQRKYNDAAWIHEPNFFALEVAERVAKGDELLDLGCGQGQDSVFFAKAGARVTAADFSPFALLQFDAAAQAVGIRQVELDLRQTPYPFDDGQFDVVYSHLSLHYFAEDVTRSIFAEIARILRPGGLLLATFNSVKDAECGMGTQLESHFFELEPGDCKRFLDEEQLRHFGTRLFQIGEISFGQGTRKKEEDQFVRLIATRTEV